MSGTPPMDVGPKAYIRVIGDLGTSRDVHIGLGDWSFYNGLLSIRFNVSEIIGNLTGVRLHLDQPKHQVVS